jgi:hypothetical protein
MAGKHEDRSIGLSAGIRANAGRGYGIGSGVRNRRDPPVLVISPGMVSALKMVAADNPQAKRKLAMGAAVFQGEHLARPGSGDGDRPAGEYGSENLGFSDLMRPRERIPIVGIDSHLP